MNQSFRVWNWCMSLAQRCANMHQFKVVHAIFITCGLHRNTYAVSKLLDFCALSNFRDLSYASQLFTQTQMPNLFIYNTLIRAYSDSLQPHLTLHYFNLLVRNNAPLSPDNYTFPFVLIACSNGFLVPEGKQIHGLVVKNSLSFSDPHVQTALIRFYAGCKVLDDAQQVFDEIASIDVFQANVLISGYIRNGLASKALSVLQGMFVHGVEPDEFCVTSGLAACANLGALDQGKWIHEYIKKKKNWLESDAFVGTALVDMYAKCGCIHTAVEVFEAMPKRTKHSWAAMIRGFGIHGFAKKAIDCLDRMQVEDGLKPDSIVLLGVLVACTHSGLQKEGRLLLDRMEPLYSVVPQHEHFSCVVDLLCKAGKLDEAIKFIRTMPMKPLASVWGALLSGCRVHNNVTLAELAVKELLLLEDGNEAEKGCAYVQLSNIYLATRQSSDARRIRTMIGDKGLKKTPGISAIEVDGEVNEFVSGDVSHPHLGEIHSVLDLMSLEISTSLVNDRA
nr:putative pentatricopeptide repeat-containing protein At3g28640 [Ipomoea batatas]